MYQTGAAETVTELLTKIGDFAASAGWVVDKLESGTRSYLFLHNNSGYWSFGESSDHKSIYIFGNAGYDSLLSYSAQPGTSYTNRTDTAAFTGTCTTEMSGPFITYDFFGTADYIHIVAQVGVNKFRHFGVGTLNKTSEYTGGQYVYGTSLYNDSVTGSDGYYSVPFSDFVHSYWSRANYVSAVRFDSGQDTRWYLFRNAVAGGSAKGIGAPFEYLNYAQHPDALQLAASKSQFGNVLAPVPESVLICNTTGIWQKIGNVPDFFKCRADGIESRSVLTINNKKLMFVPVSQYQGTSADAPAGSNNSRNYFIVYQVSE